MRFYHHRSFRERNFFAKQRLLALNIVPTSTEEVAVLKIAGNERSHREDGVIYSLSERKPIEQFK